MFERKALHCHGLVTSNKPVLPGGCDHTGTLGHLAQHFTFLATCGLAVISSCCVWVN